MTFELSISGIFVWVANATIWWGLSKKTTGIGKTMAPAIAGWISFVIGLLILNLNNVDIVNFLTATIVLYIAVIVLVIVVFLYMYASDIRNRKGVLGKVGYVLSRTGWFIGFIMGFICSALK